MSLTRQIGSLTSANLLFMLSQMVILAFLTRLTDLETVGHFGLIMAITQPMFMLLSMGMRTNIATDAKYSFTFGDFAGVLYINSIVFVAFLLGLFFWWRPEAFGIALPIVLQKAVELHNELVYGSMQRGDATGKVARSVMLRGPVAACIFGAVLWSGAGPELAFWSQTVAWLLIQVLFDRPIVEKLGETTKPVFAKHRLSAVLASAWLLGLGQFFNGLQMGIPRVMVDWELGVAALALFTPVAFLQRAVIGLFASVEQVLLARLSRQWEQQRKKAYNSLMIKTLVGAVILSLFGCGFAWVAGGAFLALVFGEEYRAAESLFWWVAIAIALRLVCNVLQMALASQRRFTSFGVLQVIVVVISVPIYWIGIQIWDLNGLGISLAAVAMVRMLLTAGLLIRSGAVSTST